MDEVRQVRAATNPAETLLVVDAMTGQDAVNTAKAFNDAVGVTGIVMTRMDGDARGGAALSMRAITGAPIKLVGVGEKQDALEDFHPERVAGRILGHGRHRRPGGDAPPRRSTSEEAEKLAAKMLRGKFDLEDYASQLRQIGKMGSLSGILGMLPGVGKIKAQLEDANLDNADPEAPGGDHLVDDTQGAARARHHQGEPQEAHRRRVRHVGAGGQQAAEAVRRHDDDDEADEQARAEGPDASRPVGADAEGHGAAQPPPVLNRRLPNRRFVPPRRYRTMGLKIRLARAGAKKRPYYHIVVADSRSPRDGRFIEKLGSYNPMLPAEHADRIRLQDERIQHWVSAGRSADRSRGAVPRQGRAWRRCRCSTSSR